MDPVRIGGRLVQKGIITAEALDRALRRQEETGQPLGLVCEELLGVDPRVVERAWAEQYAELVDGLPTDLRDFDAECVRLVTRRQAWQFAILPLRIEDGALVVATLAPRLAQSRRFMSSIYPGAVVMLVTDGPSLVDALTRHHPFPGMDLSWLERRDAA